MKDSIRQARSIFVAVGVMVAVGILAIFAQFGRSGSELSPQALNEPLENDKFVEANVDESPVESPILDSGEDDINAKIEALSPEKFNHFSSEYFTYIEIYGATMKPVDGVDLFLQDSTHLIEYLKSYAEITGVFDGIILEITDSRRKDDHLSVKFRQIVHGIPVTANGRIRFSEAGEVVSLKSWVIDPTAVQAIPTILEQEAIAHANYALGIKLGSDQSGSGSSPTSSQEGRVLSTTIEYSVVGPLERGPTPVWSIELTGKDDGRLYQAVVNAMTGETHVSWIGAPD